MTLAHARANRAILFACMAYALYSIGDAVLKYIGTALPVGSIMTTAGAVMVTLSLAALLIKRHRLGTLWGSPKIKLHLARTVVVGALATLATHALRTVPLPDFYGIIFMSPFLVGILAYFILREEIGLHRVLATVVGFIGVMILAGPHFSDLNAGYILVFIQLFIVAWHVLIVRKIGTGDPWPLLTFYPGLGILLAGMIQFVPNPVIPDPVWWPWIGLYAVAIFAGQFAFSTAFTITPLTTIIAPYLYTQMLWGVLFSVFVFHQPISETTLIGGTIIIASGIGNLLYERRLRRLHLLSIRASRPT
jgi:drug/metabolite transporter (DMT)-like permease